MFNNNTAKHAKTDPGPLLVGQSTSTQGHSTVCGQECDTAPAAPLPHSVSGSAKVAVLTCSDRASKGVYEDKSGPAITEALTTFASRSEGFTVDIVATKVVPDDQSSISDTLKAWSDAKHADVIFTTGGTGFGPRDVTPEATKTVISRRAEGISRAMAWQTSLIEPRSILSRGVCGATPTGVLVVNLPGNPAAVRQCLAVLLPVLPHALKMLKS
mmetsp:Transcript_22842/g.34286  ORF Transcript_22842/g.34286 Transcript_22842/m.34286 type:complete len:214 (-) Transcript_22842:313-954(-)